LDEKLMVLDWRNNINVRKWMYSQNKIHIDSHVDFINALLFSKDSQYMVVKRSNEFLGVVCFTKIDFIKKQICFGLYTNPFGRIKGVGSMIQEAGIKYIFDLLEFQKIKLEVFSNNFRAINLYKKFNFKKNEQKIINGRNVDYMELQR